MSSQTVVDVIVSGSTAIVVDERVNGVTTIAGAAPITNVSGQIPDLGVDTNILASQGDILSLTNDVASLRANLIITGTTLTDEIGLLSGTLISTGNELNFTINTLSGELIATGNSLDSLRNILSGNLITTGVRLQDQLNVNTDLIADLRQATGDLNRDKLDKAGGTILGNILPSASGTINLGSAELPFLSGYFKDLTVSSNTLFIGDVPIHSANGGIDFFSATGETFFRDVTIRNLTVTGTETIIDVDHLAVKDNTITLNSGEDGAGISLITGGIIIDRGSLPDADILFNEENDRFEFNFPVAIQGSPVVTEGVTGSFVTQGQLNTTGINLQNQIISNDTDISNTISNLSITGNVLSNKISTFSGQVDLDFLSTGNSIDSLSGNLITTGNTLESSVNSLTSNVGTTGQTLQAQITTNIGSITSLDSSVKATGVLLQNQITDNDSDISTLTSNLSVTGQTLQSQIIENDNDLNDISGKLGQTGVFLNNEIAIVSGIAGGDRFNELSGNLITTGQYLTSEIAIVSGMTTGGAAVDVLSGHLISTGQYLTSEVSTVSGLITNNDNEIFTLLAATGELKTDIALNATNMGTTGQFLQNQIDGNDNDITNLNTRLVSTGNHLTDITNLNISNIATVSGLVISNDGDITTLTSNLATTGQTLQTQIISNDSDISTLTTNIGATGQTLQTQITSNDSDISTLTSNLVTTGQTLTTDITAVSGLIVDNDGDITALKTATGVLKTSTDSNSANLITTGQTLQTQITSNDSDISSLTSNLVTTGQTLQTQITSNDGDISTLTTNLGTTGQTLQTQITSNDSDISTLTSNLITTGQTLTTDISTVSGLITDNDADIAALRSATGVLKTSTDANTTNLITTGQTLQTQITSNDGDITTLTSNLVTTGQTLQTQITSNDSDISTLTTNIGTTGQTLQTQITSNDSDITNLTNNLITTGQTVTTDINTVSGLITDNDADITALKTATGVLKTNSDSNTANLITTGQTLQTQISSNDSDISTLTSNLVTTGQTLTTNINTVSSNLVSTGEVVDDVSGNLIITGQTLQTQITSNDGDITTITSNLVTTGQTLTTNINTVSTNLVSTGKVIDDVSGNLITTGQTLQTQITSNDGDISTLTSNLVTTGQTLTTNVNTVSTNLISTGAVVDDISGNLITTGQTLQTQINSNDGDITTLTSNLVTTGQTLTTNINTVSTNLGTSGQTLQTQITSNDSDISTLTSNLGTTGQTLQTQITSNDSDIASLTTNLGTTGQTLQTQITSNDSDISTLDSTTVKLTTNQSVAGNKIFTNNVTINNLTVTGTEVIVDVENLAVKDNIIEINSGESSAGISKISGGIVIDRGTATNANILFNDANDRFELNFPLAVEGEVVASASNLITTGQTLTTNINTVSTNLGTSGQTLQTQITSNDSDISTLTTNLGTSGQTLQTQITSNDSDVSTLTTNLGTSGQTLQTQITSNDSDISTLTSNLVTTGQTLQTQITSNDSDISTLTANVGITGQTLQTQITSNDSDISTLTSNLVTTGQTLTTNINTVSTNLGTSGQTLQTQITSNDTDITNLTSNLVTTGQTLTTNINTVANNLGTTGQTLTSEIATVSGLIPATVIDGAGTANKVPLWSDSNTIGDSVISQSSSKVGIGTATPASKLQIISSTSGGSVLKVDGTNGTLFEVVDDLSDSLMSVNDAAGLPVFEVFADNHIVAGRYNQNDFYLNTNGNLGLGTSSPITKLNIKGDQSADGQLYIEPTNDSEYAGLVIKTTRGADRAYAIFAGGTGTDDLNFRFRDASAGVDRMVIDSSGKVGIGAINPALQSGGTGLHINGATSSELKFTNNTTGVAATDGTALVASGSSFTLNNREAGSIKLGTSNTTRVTIDSAGKVGIGTNNPSRDLEVYRSGAVNFGLTAAISGIAAALFKGRSNVTNIATGPAQGGGNLALYNLDTSDGNFNGVGFYNSNSLITSGILGVNVSHSSRHGALVFQTHNGSSLLERMRIDKDGDVGIGTDDPETKLHVYSSSSTETFTNLSGIGVENSGSSNSYYVFQTATGGGGKSFSITNAGNIGIGTTNPTAKIHVKDTSGSPTGLVAIIDRPNNLATVNQTADNPELLISGHSSNYKLVIRDHSSNGLMVVKGDGNVGIGTTSPDNTLHVISGGTNSVARFESTDATARILFQDNTGLAGVGAIGDDIVFNTSSSLSEKMRIDASGYVGIGAASPLLKLHVEAGTIYANSAKSDTVLATSIAGTATHNMIGSAGYWGIRTATNNSFNLDVYNGGSPTAALTVLNDGKVGIGGTPNSSYKLDVSGDTLIQESESGDLKLVVNNISTSTLARSAVSLINNSGSSAGLTLPSTNYTGVTGWANRLILNADSNISNGILVRPSNGGFTVSSSGLANNDLVVEDGTGYVGVGTANPSYELDVIGDISSNGQAIASYRRLRSYGTFTTSTNNTAGWYPLFNWGTATGDRGGYRVYISYTGGSWAPNTTVLKVFKNWSSDATITIEKYGGTLYLPEVRVIGDASSATVYTLEVYLNALSQGHSFVVYYEALGYDESGSSNVNWVNTSLALSSNTGSVIGSAKVSSEGIATQNLNITQDIYLGDQLIHLGDSDTYFQFHNNDNMRLVANSVERFNIETTETVVNESGVDKNFRVEGDNDQNLLFVDAGTDRVGVGDSSPSYKLDVNGNVTADTYGFRSDSAAKWYYFDTFSGSNFLGRGSNAYTSLYDTGTLSMVWKNGKVGIGTTDPGYKLDVAGNARVTTDLFVNDQLAVKTTTLATSNNFHVSSGTTGSASKSSIALVSVADDSTFNSGVAALHVINSGNRGTKGHSSGSDLLRLEFSDTIHTVFDKDGNVIVGNGGNDGGATIRPGGQTSVYALTVDRSGSSGTSVDIWDYNSNSVIIGATSSEKTLTVKAGGNVGIGTASPNDKLDIYGNMRVRGGDGFGANSTANYNPSFVAYPGGGKIGSASSSQAGYVKITLPQSWTNTMMQFSVDIFEYQANEAKTFVLAGYNYAASSSWVNASAMVLAGDDGTTYKVQFGHDGSKCAIYISKGSNGASSSWTYPYVVVRDASFGFLNTGISNWIDGWSVSFSTATLSGITQTRDVSTQVTGAGTSQYITKWNSTGTEINDSVIVQDSNNIGIGTASPSYKLHTVGGAGVFDVTGAATLNHHLAVTEVATLPDWRPYSGTTTAALQIQSSATRGILLAAKSTGNQDFYNTEGLDIYVGSTVGASSSNRGILAISAKSDGKVGVGADDPIGKLQIGDNYTIDSNFGGDDIYIKGTTNRTSYDPNIYHTDDIGALITISDSDVVGPTKPGLVLYNDDVTAGGFSPMLLFSKRETGDSPYKATMAGIYARSPLGTGDSNSWIDGELIFATAGAASQGIKQRMVINKEGFVGIGTISPEGKLHIYTGNSGGSVNTSADELVIESASTGGIQFLNGSTASGYILFGDSGGNSTGQIRYLHTDDSMRLHTSGSERLIIDASGNVGIGTASPASKLDILGSTNSSLILTRTSSGIVSNIEDASGYGALALYQAGGGVKAYITGNGSSYLLGGNVGIGTTTPAYGLDIRNSTTSQTGALYVQAALNSSGKGLVINSNTRAVADNAVHLLQIIDRSNSDSLVTTVEGVTLAKLSTRLNTLSPLQVNSQIALGGSLYTFSTVQGGADLTLTSNANPANIGVLSNIKFKLGSSGGGGPNERMRIQSDGSIGVWNTTDIENWAGSSYRAIEFPRASLMYHKGTSTDVYINSNAYYDGAWKYKSTAAASQFVLGSSGDALIRTIASGTIDTGFTWTTPFIVKNTGEVGIGTTSPNNPLDVVGYIKSSIGFKAANYTTMLESGNESVFGNTAYYGVLFKTNNVTRMKITNAGLVGIGTVIPSQKLHVVGKALITDDVQLTGSNPRIDFNTNGASSLRFYDTTNSAERMRINTSGNVGINAASPTSKLQVVGSTSGDSVLKIDGTNGTLFEVVDDLSDSLMSVNDAAGLPVFEVFADNTIVGGRYNKNDFYLEGSSGKIGMGTGSPDATGLTIQDTAGNVNSGTRGVFALKNYAGVVTHRFSSQYVTGFASQAYATYWLFNPVNSNTAFYVRADNTLGPRLQLNNSSGSSSIYLSTYAGVPTAFNVGKENIDFNVRGDSDTNLFYVDASTDRIGIGTASPTRTLHVVGAIQIDGTIDANSGAHLTSGGVWTDASSRELKKDIVNLSLIKASEVVKLLNPVEFSYKAAPEERRVGFIAEDVPDLVASEGRKGLSSMQIVAALTKVVQNQQKEIKWCKEQIEKLTKIK